MRSDPPEEPIDLTPEQRRRIDEVFGSLESTDHHGVIGVAPGSDAATIRRAYYERVAEFHPDRFFRKRIGGYLAKMEAISRKVTDAYEALSSREKRAARDPSRRPSSAPPPAPPRPGRAPAEALRALDRRAGSTPAFGTLPFKEQLDARRAESRRLVAEAERAASHGDRVAAAEAYRKAALLSPNDAAIAAAHASARQAIGVVAAEAHARQAELEERFGHWAEAARTWRLVADARPTEALAHGRLAAALLRGGGEADQAVRAAARAAELEPGEPRHRALLAEAQARQSQRGGDPGS